MKTEVKFREPEEKQSIKDRLKGTCLLNESKEVGAEIVKLYTEAGFRNTALLNGSGLGFYGEKDGYILFRSNLDDFRLVIDIDQLRQIVRGEEKPMPGESINEYRKRVLGLDHFKEASPEAQEDFVKANPGMQHVEEPKAGDMVEATNSSFMTILTKGRFTGGKSESGDFIVELGGSFIPFKYIRLPQKSEVESKAKELWNLPENQDLHAWEIVMQGIEWGQANPGKI